MRKLTLAALVVAAALAVSACNDTPGPTRPHPDPRPSHDSQIDQPPVKDTDI